MLFINFVGVVSSWLVESHHKSGQLKHQSIPGASSEGKQVLHCSHCVLSSSFNIQRLPPVTPQQIRGASMCSLSGRAVEFSRDFTAVISAPRR